MKKLLALFLLVLGINVQAAESAPPTLLMEVFRFDGEAGLFKDLTPEEKMVRIAHKRLVMAQSAKIEPDGTARSLTRMDVYTLKVDATCKPAKDGARDIDLAFSLVEQIPIESGTTPTTYATTTRVLLKPWQRRVVGSWYSQSNDSVGNWQVLVASFSD